MLFLDDHVDFDHDALLKFVGVDQLLNALVVETEYSVRGRQVVDILQVHLEALIFVIDDVDAMVGECDVQALIDVRLHTLLLVHA